MRVIMFQPQFADKVARGEKRQTIRTRARCEIGDTLSLRTWKDKPYRSKHVTLRAETCLNVADVFIDYRGIMVNGLTVALELEDRFAQNDGFDNFGSMCAWFQKVHGLPFGGELIVW